MGERAEGEQNRVQAGGGRYLMVLVAMSCLMMASLGLAYKLQGLFFAPVASDLGVGRGQASMMLTILNLTSALAGLLAARLLSRWPLKAVVLSGTVCLAGSTALLSLGSSIAVMYVLSAIQGFGAGLLGAVTVTAVLGGWFQARRALAMSVAFGASGIAGALAAPVVSRVIDAAGWRMGYLVSAALMAALCVPALLLPVRLSAAEAGVSPYGAGSHDERSGAPGAAQAHPIPGALILTLAYGAFVGFSTAITHHFPGYADSAGLPVEVGALMVSVCMLANTAGKVVLGWLIDRFGLRASTMAYLAAALAGAVLLLLVPAVPVVYVAAGLMGCVFALVTVSTAALVRSVFGDGGYGAVYPKANLATTLGSALGVTAVGVAYDATGGYAASLYGLCAMFAICLAAVIYLLRDQGGSPRAV